MAWIDEGWLRGALTALKNTLGNDPKLKQQMIEFLLAEGFWDADSLKWDAAVARFNDCLNPNKAQFFKLGELWALMKRFDRHHLFLAMAADLGYEVRRIPTEARRIELLERIAEAVAASESHVSDAVAELARLTDPNQDHEPVTIGIDARALRFSLPDDWDSIVDRVGCP